MFGKLINFAFKNALRFDDREATTVIIISILSGFILSFRKWGITELNVSEGISNLILYSILFLVLFFVYLVTQKFTAALYGLDAKVHIWKYGPPIGVLVTIMSFGFIPFVFLGGIKLNEIPRLRLGLFRGTVPRVKDMMIIGMTGPMMLILLSLLIFFPMYQISTQPIFLNLIKISGIILIVSALPFPSLNGINILMNSRFLWVTYLFYTIFLYFLIYLLINVTSSIRIYLLALIISLIVAWLIQHAFTEKHK